MRLPVPPLDRVGHFFRQAAGHGNCVMGCLSWQSTEFSCGGKVLFRDLEGPGRFHRILQFRRSEIDFANNFDTDLAFAS